MALTRAAKKDGEALVARAETHEAPDRRTLASVALGEAGEFALLRDIANGQQTYVLGVDNVGALVHGAAPLRDRMAALKILIEYAEGKPRVQPSGEGKGGPERGIPTSADAVDTILGQLERMARIAGVAAPQGIQSPLGDVPIGESQLVEEHEVEQPSAAPPESAVRGNVRGSGPAPDAANAVATKE